MRIFKIGGGKDINLQGIVSQISKIEEPYIIVHGANALRDELLTKLKLEKQIITSLSGQSSVYTDQNMIDVILMSYAGMTNKRIVELFLKQGLNPIGLSGADGRLVQAKRNRGIKAVVNTKKKKIIRDQSGKPYEINVDLINYLLESNYIPILTMPLADENGNLVNSENDDVVAKLTEVLPVSSVTMFIEAPGFLMDPNNEKSLVHNVSSKELEDFISASELRMKRKLTSIQKIVASCNVYLTDGRVDSPLLTANEVTGTTFEMKLIT